MTSNYTKIVRQFPSKVTNVVPSSALKVLCGLFGSWEWMDGMPVSWFWSHFVREYFYSWHFSKIDLVGNTMGVRFIWWLLFRPGNVQFPTGQDSWQICVCDGIEWWDRDVAGLFWWRTQLMWRNDVHLQDHYDDDMINMMMTWLLRWWYRVVFFNWPPPPHARLNRALVPCSCSG